MAIIAGVIAVILFGARLDFRANAQEQHISKTDDHIEKIDSAIQAIAQNEAVLNAILQERTGKPTIINNTSK